MIMKFWMDKGVAGFRLDAAKEFYTGRVSKNVEVLSWLQKAAVAIDPDVYMVAEVWEGFSTITDYYESGITSIFNFAFGDTSGKIISVIRGAGNPAVVSTFATALEKADKAYAGHNPNYIDAPFLSNHDVGRIAGFCNKDMQKTKLAGAMNLFMSGSAFIYYGEEIGMTGAGNDPSKRAPMYWNAARNDGTTQPPPECIVPGEYPFGSLQEQRDDDASVYNYYRQAIAIRQAVPAISHGRTVAETALNKGCVSAFRKIWEGEECIILMNISPEIATVDLTQYAAWELAAQLCTDQGKVTFADTALQLPAYAVAVLIPKN
jgi:glycosidase